LGVNIPFEGGAVGVDSRTGIAYTLQVNPIISTTVLRLATLDGCNFQSGVIRIISFQIPNN